MFETPDDAIIIILKDMPKKVDHDLLPASVQNFENYLLNDVGKVCEPSSEIGENSPARSQKVYENFNEQKYFDIDGTNFRFFVSTAAVGFM